MAYCYKTNESVGEGTCRVARELTEESLALLDAPDSDSLEQNVHQVRKNCKKLRGLLRLVRPGLGDDYREANAAFRDAARELSGARDAHALLETFDALVAAVSGGDPRLAEVRGALQVRSREASDALARDQSPLRSARERMLEGARRVAEPPRVEDTRSLVRDGLERTYKRGRKAMLRAREKPSDEALHEWRKRAKYTWYHLRLSERAAPSVLGPLAGSFHDLADTLGDDHDLAVFVAGLESAPDVFGGSQPVGVARRVAAWVREDLQDRALRLGARLYAERPRAFAERLASYWEVWQRDGDERPAGELDEVFDAEDDLEECSVRELYLRARKLDVRGRSNMSRAELVAAVRAAGGS